VALRDPCLIESGCSTPNMFGFEGECKTKFKREIVMQRMNRFWYGGKKNPRVGETGKDMYKGEWESTRKSMINPLIHFRAVLQSSYSCSMQQQLMF